MARRLWRLVSSGRMIRLAVCLICVTRAACSMLAAAPAQPEALELLQAPGATPGEPDVLLALERGWFEAAKRILGMMRERGDPVASMAAVRSSATKIREQATEVINLMRTGANAEETVVNTAFQWAQRPEYVYLNVKFSSRIDGPVTCLNVDNERVEFGNNTVYFEGTGRQKPKLFRLNLTLYGAIEAERSSWTFASVGRISLTLAKAVNETWPRLLETKAKPKNMHAWYDRQQALDADVKKEKEERKKAAAATPATPPSTPPTPSAPADPPTDGGAPPPPPTPAELPANPPSMEKGKKDKKKKKKAKKEKDEV